MYRLNKSPVQQVIVAAEELTDRVREVLFHLGDGESYKVIARQIKIVEATVKVHVKHLLKKLGLKTRVGG